MFSGIFARLRKFPKVTGLEMERPMRIELTPEPWQIWGQRNFRNLRGTFRSIQ